MLGLRRESRGGSGVGTRSDASAVATLSTHVLAHADDGVGAVSGEVAGLLASAEAGSAAAGRPVGEAHQKANLSDKYGGAVNMLANEAESSLEGTAAMSHS